MKGALLATAAAALAGSAVADIAHMRRHGHDALHRRALFSSAPVPEESCGCTTEVVTFWGEPTLVTVSAPTPSTVSPVSTVTSETTTTVHSTSYTTVTIIATPSETPSETPSATPTLPTAGVTTFPETGTYTIPATTLTVTDTTTVCGATTTELPSGTQTYGGVTTIVETETTIVCPYATVKPTGTTVTSVIETTTYVCPSAGTYTINPTTTYVPTSTVVVYPTPATITPGTYTQPETTVTVTRTDYTYYCPFSNANEPTTTAVATTTAAVTTTAVPTTTVAPTTTAVVTTSTAAPSTSSTTQSTIPTNGPQMGMTFTPYTDSGDCMAKADVLSRIANIKAKGFTHVRVYDTTCHTLEYVGEAVAAHGLKLILGIYIDSNGIGDDVYSQVDEIAAWAQWDLVTLVAAGNEAVNSGFCTAGALADFVAYTKEHLQSAGYTGQVTTAEPIDVWLASGSTLCPVVDILGANLHPFFNAAFTAAQAGELVSNQISDLKAVCTGKDVINLETGWPNAGDANGLAVPGQSEQTEAIKSLVDKVGSLSVFFSYSDDPWKIKYASSDKWQVETHWGCIDQF